MQNLRVTELDFDDIKLNLKAFLQSQDTFSDYDFEGSGLNALLDLLAYNTHYNAYLANMLANEMFLDSAVKRASVVSLAKHLGYTPLSARGAKATLDVTINNVVGLPSSIVLPRYSTFSSTLNSNTFTFFNVEEYTTTPVSGVYTFRDIDVIEGELTNFAYVAESPGPSEKFILNEENVDTSTIRVIVQNSVTDETVEAYTLSTDITGVTGNSKVYFLEENPQGKFQIYFGDGIIGKKLDRGNLILVRYLVSSGTVSNVSRNTTQSFTLSTTVAGSTTSTITTKTNSRGGAFKEQIESVRFNAPLINAAKNRAVTATDYEALIKANFAEAEGVSVWGGEDNVPPTYGKVFISLKPFTGFIISQETKRALLRDVLNPKKVLAIQPEFVDPDFYHINLTVDVKFNSLLTTLTASQVSTLVRETIQNYFSTELGKFNTDFNKSKLIKLILDTNPSISSVLMFIKLQRRLPIRLNALNSFIDDDRIQFQNKIVPGSVLSSKFLINVGGVATTVVFKDIPNVMPPDPEGTGTLSLFNSTTNLIVTENAGTVFYGTSSLVINPFTPTALPSGISDLRFLVDVQEVSHNIDVKRNQIIVLDDSVLNAAIGSVAGLTVNVSSIVE